MQLRAENQNLVSALSNYQQILYQFFDFTQNLKQSLKLRSTPLTTHVDVSTTSDSSHGKLVSAFAVFVQNIVQIIIANIVNKATYFFVFSS